MKCHVLDDDAFQKLVDTLYKTFFTFLPSLAGSAETGAARDARLRDLDASEPTAEDAHAHAEAVSESDDE